MMKMLEQIWVTLRSQKVSGSFELPDGVQLPCATIEELKAVEAQLSSENAFRQQFTAALRRHAASRLETTIRNIGCALLINSLAAKLNMQGTDRKVGFQSTFPTLLKCIHG
ncbi:MAG: DUF4806 domain-containing protein [Kangiellaceae bacterium]|jgi:hypothetical protein|nr:DUF4806 domain-containing protein [Kangiellaceae bacterium]